MLYFVRFNPNHFSIVVSGDWVFITDLYDNCAFVKTETDHIGLSEGVDGPDTFEPIVKLSDLFVRSGTPHIDEIVFCTTQQYWELRMESHTAHALSMTLIKCKEALARLVVPHLHHTVITARCQVRFVSFAAKINTIHSR